MTKIYTEVSAKIGSVLSYYRIVPQIGLTDDQLRICEGISTLFFSPRLEPEGIASIKWIVNVRTYIPNLAPVEAKEWEAYIYWSRIDSDNIDPNDGSSLKDEIVRRVSIRCIILFVFNMDKVIKTLDEIIGFINHSNDPNSPKDLLQIRSMVAAYKDIGEGKWTR